MVLTVQRDYLRRVPAASRRLGAGTHAGVRRFRPPVVQHRARADPRVHPLPTLPTTRHPEDRALRRFRVPPRWAISPHPHAPARRMHPFLTLGISPTSVSAARLAHRAPRTSPQRPRLTARTAGPLHHRPAITARAPCGRVHPYRRRRLRPRAVLSLTAAGRRYACPPADAQPPARVPACLRPAGVCSRRECPCEARVPCTGAEVYPGCECPVRGIPR